jgi:PadR family transcriptional regulator, regulatory protein PadR
MNPQFKKGVLELCVLSLLSKGDKYGYELTEAISKQMSIAAGTLYLVLKRLNDEGYFSTYLVESESGPARKYYRLTDKGKNHQQALKEGWYEFIEQVDHLIKENSND